MNKSDLVARLAMEVGLSRRQAVLVMDTMLKAITSSVAKGERVTLPGFGTFELRERAPRTGRNPRTGEAVKVPATRVPAFRPGNDFRELVRTGRRRKAAAAARRPTLRAR